VYKRQALNSHPELAQRKREVTVADLSVAAAQANFRPKIAGTASLNTTPDDNEKRVDTATLGLSFRQTIYAGGAISSAYRQSVARRDAARASLAQGAISVSEGVGNAWANVEVANASISAGDLQIQAAETAFEGVREEASLGARTTLDVLDAEQNLLDARATRATAVAQRYVGVYNLLASMGLLSVEHLKLGVPTYDPSVYYNEVKSAPVTSPQGKALDRILGKVGAGN
jgi:outer membrane protein